MEKDPWLKIGVVSIAKKHLETHTTKSNVIYIYSEGIGHNTQHFLYSPVNATHGNIIRWEAF